MNRLIFFAVVLLFSGTTHAGEQRFQIIIRGGLLHDGRGGKPVRADIALHDGRIAGIGVLSNARADREIDARGLHVAPGFIDGHSHVGDRELLQVDSAGAVPLLAQGVTTVFINADGGGMPNLAAQRARILASRPGVNVAPMIGHRAVRVAVLGMSARPPSDADMEKMKELVNAAFDQDGAFGLSSGLIYAPANFATTDELISLARIASRYGGFYHSHIRDESDTTVGLIPAVEELIAIVRAARLTGVVTHIKAAGPGVWGKAPEVIRLIEAARDSGLDVWADQYPYDASATLLSALVLPGWAQADGMAKVRERLANPDTRRQIHAEATAIIKRRAGPSAFLITEFKPDPAVQGLRLNEIARRHGLDAAEAALTLIERGEPRVISFSMREEDVVAFMRKPWTMTASDGFGGARAHPRSFGTFPRKLRTYALERKIISLEQALHSMTGLPARVLGLQDRGELRTGAAADIVVFDPRSLKENATYTEPEKIGGGVVHVFVNGKAALLNGEPTGLRAGKVLRRGVRTKHGE